jgi:hypothetical protein
MPVYYKLKGVSSNKQEETGKKKEAKIQYKDISYVPIKGQVAVLKPIIDKISITYKIDDPDLKAVVVQNLLQEIEAGGGWQSGAFKTGSVAYQASAKLMIPSSSHSVLVQAGPKKKTTTHSRRFTSPSSLKGSAVTRLSRNAEKIRAR